MLAQPRVSEPTLGDFVRHVATRRCSLRVRVTLPPRDRTGICPDTSGSIKTGGDRRAFGLAVPKSVPYLSALDERQRNGRKKAAHLRGFRESPLTELEPSTPLLTMRLWGEPVAAG